jgi:hypothetical protein
MSKKNKSINKDRGQFNSVQLNVVTYIDVQNANVTMSLSDNLFMVDNGVNSKGRGTADLQTTCKQGQVINWLLYPLNMTQNQDGSWPPMAKINNIVFTTDDGQTEYRRVCTEFKIYGGPDKIRSKNPNTPVYYYWAGTVLNDLPVGVYKYRFVLELDTADPNKKNYMNLDSPSLNVILVNPEA